MEEKVMDWLAGQTMTIPIDKFIEMKTEMYALQMRNSELCATKWEYETECKALREENKELRVNLDDAKSQIRALLGVDEESTDADDGR